MDLRLILHDEVDSTSERAFCAISSGEARHGDVHLANAQSAGRGRLGRRWSSPRGEGLYLSLVLMPSPPPWNAAALTIAAGLATYDAARELGVVAARLKWPNDLVVGSAAGAPKLAGVLVETRGLDPARPHYVVGVGFNVAQRSFPPELSAERAVASLATLGLAAPLEVARQAVLAAMARRMSDLPIRHAPLADDYLAATGLAGRNLRVRVGEQDLEGVLESLAIDGGVRIRAEDGTVLRFPLEVVRCLDPCL